MKHQQNFFREPSIQGIDQMASLHSMIDLQLALGNGDEDELDDVLWPTFGGFLIFCAFSLFVVGAVGTAIVFYWFAHLQLLAALTAYFAIGNAVLLAGAVVVALMSVESYDFD